jgi:hypothetical protein
VGDSLNSKSLEAFYDELQKVAGFVSTLKTIGEGAINKLRSPTGLGLKAIARVGKGSRGLFKGVEDGGQRLAHPLEGLRKGWEEASPLAGIGRKAKEMGFGSLPEARAALKDNPEALKKLLNGGGEHLIDDSPGVFNSLSRGGWTGEGKITKYLPNIMGTKMMLTVPPALAIPGIASAEAPTPTSEGGAMERGLGELGGGAGFVMGAGLGLVPGTAMWYGGNALGSRLGRVLDRVRGGASLGTAVSAPSPTEASDQLESIQKYYGSNG